ncbi:hypothetical protein Tco_0645984 [Tanacetum coccineum]
MTTLQFADTHNLVAFLAKPAKSEGFEQIVDFLNASSIRYALTVNPTIYTSCIEQFWATVKVKTFNGEQQLQALVDGKKIIITEATVRRDLQLEDADGVDCLPNATIFEQLTLIGAKTTAWNEFSSTMASAIICLATNQKFNFSKYIFESMVKNLDNAVKFLMYPRFVQVFLNNQLEGMATHNRIYIAPSHTKKICANMRRQGKDFSGRETPLFPTMVVQAQEEMGEGSAIPTDPHHTPIITQPSSSQPQRKQKSRRPKEKDTQVPQSSVPSDPTNIEKLALMGGWGGEGKRVKKLEKKGGSRTHKLKRLYRVGRFARVVSFEEASLGDQEDASKPGRYGDEYMFGVNDLDGDEVVVESEVTDKAGEKRNIVEEAVAVTDAVTILVSAATITNVELTLAQTLVELKMFARPKTKGVVMQEPSESTPTISLQLPSQVKGLQAKFDEEDRLAREKAQQVEEANIAWDDIQAKIDADYQLAERLKERSTLQLREQKKREIDHLQELNKGNVKSFKRVNTFVDFITELVEVTEMEESSKKQIMVESKVKEEIGDQLQQESTKKQKMDNECHS